ncbi:BCNT-domain-containing protein [Delitschia confertaspora ATCC 74209]|uniref:SWR1-complex protein 5 n=1 Tax=Delitschia confertaspora ATCC 74209 TaxID=1513339 RepID=A0A9P4JH87_9PLEO|nr:BCNT-domain-containing protein [Delitschia confertaspora ATCC 74209]
MAGADGHATTDTEGEELTVLRVYTFAGQKTAEEKRIPRSSLGQYLRDGWKQPTSDVADKTKDVDIKTSKSDTVDADDDKQPKLHRPLRRPLRRPSRFDPNPSAFVRGLAPEFQLTYPRKPTSSSSSVPAIHVIDNTQENTPGVTQHINGLRPYKAQKLNVVDKSRLDWTGYVDQEGIAEELDVHGKGREAYLGRMEFLRGVEARREEERRRVKEKVGNKAGAV